MPPKRKASKLPTSKDSDSSKKAKSSWTAEEDEALLKAVQEDRDNHEEEEEEEDWDEIANAVPGKSAVQCLKRHMVLVEKEKEKASPKKKKVAASPAVAARASADDAGSGEDGNWTGNEIELLRKLVEQYEDGKWTESLNM